MIIANPISDLVFKWLMSNDRIARFFLETLLEQEIVDVQLKPQELSYFNKEDDVSLSAALTVMRLDFVATIKTASGEHKKVLIEIQKARNTVDIMRFRKYLAEHYKQEDVIETDKGKQNVALPIITIYLLGFKLQNVDTPALKVALKYINQVTHEVMDIKSDLIEKLTHESYIVQIPRIESKLNSRLEQLLSFFEQNHFTDSSGLVKEYPYPLETDLMKLIADELHYLGTDPKKQQYLETEREAMRVYKHELFEIELEVEENKKAIEENKKVLEENKKVLEENKKAIEEKERILEENKKVLEENKKVIDEMDKELEEKDKVLDENKKVIDEMDKELEEKNTALQEALYMIELLQKKQ